MKTKIVCIIGESGGGKTSLLKSLELEGEINIIQSYTSREPRYEGEWGHEWGDGHLFIEHSLADEVVASTYFNGNLYWANKKQFDEEKINIYVIDRRGIDLLRLLNKDEYEVYVIYINTDEMVRMERQVAREVAKGGEEDEARDKMRERIEHDREAFKGLEYDFMINGDLPMNINTVILENILLAL